jgi:hypothetical protein
LAELSQRTHNEWDLTYTAVVNALAPGAPVEPGTLIKVAVREPYVPKPASPPDPGRPAPDVGPAPEAGAD